MIEEAILYAIEKHRGQVYSFPIGDKPYILHCLNVAARYGEQSEPMTFSDEDFAICILHDAQEDNETVSYQELEEKFGQYVADGITILSRDKDNETYMEYIERVKDSPYVHIKIADLQENLSNCRLNDNRYARYIKALEVLSQ